MTVTTARTRHQRTRIIGDVEESLFHVGLGHAFDGVAQFLGQQLGGIGVDHVVDLRHVALFHQQLDHIHSALGHAVGELLDGDGFGNGNLAHELFLRLVGGVPLQPLYAAAECCDRSLTLFVGTERRHQCEPSATFLRDRCASVSAPAPAAPLRPGRGERAGPLPRRARAQAARRRRASRPPWRPHRSASSPPARP